MSKVYFSKDIQKLIDGIDYSSLGKNVAIKLHFGEKGCNTHLNPEIARKLYEKIKSLGKNPTLVECNVLYKGSRVHSTIHKKTALDHGFTYMDIDILDGEDGSEYVDLDGCKIGAGIKKYDSMVVLTHFKGHMAAGFGGALKNLGMGLGSRAGKLDMHSGIKPSINANCTGCGTCLKNCNANAIILVNGKAVIDQDMCEGCAMCIAVCNYRAVNIPWAGRTYEDLQKKIAEYSKSVLTLFPNPIFINVMQNITKECDCMGVEQKPMMPDVGFLYSTDIVAIDKASIDLANKHSNNRFGKINSINKDKQIEFAEKLGLGSSKYELIKI